MALNISQLSEQKRRQLFIVIFCIGSLIILGCFVWGIYITWTSQDLQSDREESNSIIPDNITETRDTILENIPDTLEQETRQSTETSPTPDPE